MASLLENKPLLYSLLATTTVLFLLATGFMPELGVFLEISPFTDEVSTVTFHAVSVLYIIGVAIIIIIYISTPIDYTKCFAVKGIIIVFL